MVESEAFLNEITGLECELLSVLGVAESIRSATFVKLGELRFFKILVPFELMLR